MYISIVASYGIFIFEADFSINKVELFLKLWMALRRMPQNILQLFRLFKNIFEVGFIGMENRIWSLFPCCLLFFNGRSGFQSDELIFFGSVFKLGIPVYFLVPEIILIYFLINFFIIICSYNNLLLLLLKVSCLQDLFNQVLLSLFVSEIFFRYFDQRIESIFNTIFCSSLLQFPRNQSPFLAIIQNRSQQNYILIPFPVSFNFRRILVIYPSLSALLWSFEIFSVRSQV